MSARCFAVELRLPEPSGACFSLDSAASISLLLFDRDRRDPSFVLQVLLRLAAMASEIFCLLVLKRLAFLLVHAGLLLEVLDVVEQLGEFRDARLPAGGCGLQLCLVLGHLPLDFGDGVFRVLELEFVIAPFWLVFTLERACHRWRRFRHDRQPQLGR